MPGGQCRTPVRQCRLSCMRSTIIARWHSALVKAGTLLNGILQRQEPLRCDTTSGHVSCAAGYCPSDSGCILLCCFEAAKHHSQQLLHWQALQPTTATDQSVSTQHSLDTSLAVNGRPCMCCRHCRDLTLPLKPACPCCLLARCLHNRAGCSLHRPRSPGTVGAPCPGLPASCWG